MSGMLQATSVSTHLLIVDDDTSNLELLNNAFLAEDYDIAVANNGATALRMASSDPPDLILLDVTMPDMDGFQVCRRLKEDPATRDVPVIFMTAHDQPVHRIQAFQVGAVDYISKPFEMAELLGRLTMHLSIRRLTKALKEQNEQLQEEIQQRAEAEATLAHRTEELRQAKERLEQELVERERAEAARTALQEQIIAVQRERLRELSTPLIPITEQIVAMPLVGTLDVERAQRVLETALEGAAARRARFVILDITGVRSVDRGVADMLVRTDQGLKLLGASAVITGVGPEVARALIELQVSLGSLVTRGTLQDGIAYAMRASRDAGGKRLASMRAR